MASPPSTRPSGPSGRVTLYGGRWIELDRLTIDEGETVEVAAPPADECIVSLLAGRLEWNGRPAARRSVFEDRAHAAYLPPGSRLTVGARARCDLLVATSRFGDGEQGQPVVLVGPEQVTVQGRGRHQWSREVHDVVTDGVPARHLLAGETFNPPGGWSSFPPHKHDGRDGEPELEEVYHFRFSPEEGFGFQGLDDESGARAFLVRDGDTVGIPSGYHPVCAAPGFRLCYVWMLAGPVRRLEMWEDPRYSYLHATP